MSSKGFKHVNCPKCERPLMPVNFSAHPQLTGQLFSFCPACLLVWYSETVYDEKPQLYKAKFNKRLRLTNDTYEIYETMHLCLQQYLEFLVNAWNSRKLSNEALHTIYCHMKHLEQVNNLVVARMQRLEKYRKKKEDK